MNNEKIVMKMKGQPTEEIIRKSMEERERKKDENEAEEEENEDMKMK